MSPRAAPATSDAEQADANRDKIPACQSCRRKKAKCNREEPCSQCIRHDVICIYDNGRLKPGLRAGAVEQLQRRVETLENMFLGQGVLLQNLWDATVNGSATALARGESSEDLSQMRDRVRDSMLQLAPHRPDSDGAGTGEGRGRGQIDHSQPTKRRKLEPERDSHGLPSEPVVDELVEFYFAKVHHWIPVLHVTGFRRQIQTPAGRSKAIYILHAIVATCIRFATHPEAGDGVVRAQLATDSRQKVMLHSMESFSVENLQALVIIAFDTIGSGKGPSAWSIIGSMSRTVEQLQLSVEESTARANDTAGEYLIQRMVFLPPSSSWSQEEERRRVFWTVFLMDRFCSVSTGWNLSLTSADVQRRLPCEGSFWVKEQKVITPFFGIVDKRNVLSHSPRSGDASSMLDAPDLEGIGGFAYCIEATESLTLVVNFFLHHALDLRDTQKAQVWLMKFKELDLRLVQWKLALPARWRDASVLNQDGILDANLTLAHMTHSAALILLHQSIAYPPKHWKGHSAIRLPSTVSADTCIEAASEIATVGQEFLQHSAIILNPQFSFCLFIAGRILLAHSNYTRTPLLDHLGGVIASLVEISHRWAGPDTEKENLASVFAKRLLKARREYETMASSYSGLDIRQTAYSDAAEKHGAVPENGDVLGQPEVNISSDAHLDSGVHPSEFGLHLPRSQHTLSGLAGPAHPTGSPSGLSPTSSLYQSLSLAFPPLPLSLQQQLAPLTDDQTLVQGFLLPETSHDPLYPSHAPNTMIPAQDIWTPISQSGNPSSQDPKLSYTRYLDGS